jgi:hypothetical protein
MNYYVAVTLYFIGLFMNGLKLRRLILILALVLLSASNVAYAVDAVGSKGPRGDKGPTGDKGPQGNIGRTGNNGSRGDKGQRGDKGVVGLQGIQGVQGIKGPAGGSVGAKGDTGAIGPKGDAGTVGPQGDTGAVGAVGAKGDVGVAGAKGDTGAVGPAGAKGDTGAIGPKGDAGTVGPQGDKGVKGDAGSAAAATHSAPVFVDANGNYIGTFLYKAGNADIGFACQVSEPPTCNYGALLILPTDYLLSISDSGELINAEAAAWDNSNCSGSVSLAQSNYLATTELGNIYSVNSPSSIPSSPPEYALGRMKINSKTVEVMKQTWVVPASTSTGIYYLPNNPVLYNGTAYTWGYVLNPTTTYYDLVCQEVADNYYYKLIPNDPAVTGYDPVYINSLQKPFRISIN